MTAPRGARAVLLAVVLVVSVVAPAVGPVGEASAAPSGFVTMPDSAIQEDLPVNADVGVTRADLTGSTMVSSHASTTDIVLTTPKRAAGYLNGGEKVPGSGEIALVISDDTAHEGRQVAVPASAIEAATGRIPEAVHGTHEDGSEWTRQVTAESGLLIFEVPHFSSNTVTFSGTVNISGTYSDGSSISYDLTDVDAATDPNITLTGVRTTDTDTESGSVNSGGALDLNVAGNAEPSDASVTVTVPDDTTTGSNPTGTATEETIHYNGDDGEVAFVPSESGTLQELSLQTPGSGSGDITTDIRIVQEAPDSTSGEGTKVASTFSWPSPGSEATITLDSGYDVTGGTKYTIEFVKTSGTGSRWYDTASHSSGTWIYDPYQSTTMSNKAPLSWKLGSADTATSTTVSGTSSVSFGDIGVGQSVTKTVPIDSSTANLDVSYGNHPNAVDVSADYTEKTDTLDPAVSLNGEVQGSHSGVLSPGATATYTGNASALQSGTNNVKVSMGSVSSDAPAPTVDLSYEHDASDDIAVEYAAEGWTERYNVSHTYSSTQESPTLTVPFAGEVHELVRLEEQTDGGTWSSVPTDRYSLNGSTLTVQLDDGDGDGDVDAGTEVAVRTTARRVEVLNGSITVTDPILPGEGADVEFKIDSRSSGFAIDLQGLPTEGVRYTYSESWSSPESRVVVTASGAKRLELPNAAAGDSARVTHIPVTVTPETGEAVVQVADPDEPTITLASGASSGDDVSVTYLEASTGTTYELYSTSRDRVVATSTADAGSVTFLEDDSAESLRIQANASSGGGGMFADAGATAPSYGVDRPILIMGGLAGLVLLLVWATGRSGLAGTGRWVLVGAVAGGAGLLAFEALNPGSISSRIGEGLGSVVPLGGIAAIGLISYSLVSWWRSRQKEASTPETSVSFNLRGRDK